MAVRLSTGLRNALVGTDGAGFGEIMNNGVLDIFTGAQPVSANHVETGTKLARISSTSGTAAEDGLKFGTTGDGTLTIGTPAWTGVILVDGVAGWFRFYGSGGVTGTSGTAIRFDGAVGVSGSDLDLTHTNLTKDAVLTIKAATIVQPAE
jgi:hypothetical protein